MPLPPPSPRPFLQRKQKKAPSHPGIGSKSNCISRTDWRTDTKTASLTAQYVLLRLHANVITVCDYSRAEVYSIYTHFLKVLQFWEGDARELHQFSSSSFFVWILNKEPKCQLLLLPFFWMKNLSKEQDSSRGWKWWYSSALYTSLVDLWDG